MHYTARAKATMVWFIKSTMPIIVICLTISAELRLVTDGQTDGQSNSSPNFWATWLCLTYTDETEATMRRLFRDDSLSRFDRTPACCDREMVAYRASSVAEKIENTTSRRRLWCNTETQALPGSMTLTEITSSILLRFTGFGDKLRAGLLATARSTA